MPLRLLGVMEADAPAAGPLRLEFDRTAASEAALRSALAGMGVRVRRGAPPLFLFSIGHALELYAM